jgi:hypothetical protein
LYLIYLLLRNLINGRNQRNGPTLTNC